MLLFDLANSKKPCGFFLTDDDKDVDPLTANSRVLTGRRSIPATHQNKGMEMSVQADVLRIRSKIVTVSHWPYVRVSNLHFV